MRKYISFILLLTLVYSCSKESALEPSSLDKNWFERKDNPNSEIDHEIYKIYEDTKVAVLYSDILGTEEREGGVVYEHKMNLTYNLYKNNTPPVIPELLEEDEHIMSGINFVKDKIIAKLPSNLYPNGILLTKILHSYELDGDNNKVLLELKKYIGFNCVSIGFVDKFSEKTDKELTDLANEIIAFSIGTKLPKLYKKEVEGFYQLNYNEDWQLYYYGKSLETWFTGEPLGEMLPFKKPEEYGFIEYTENYGDYKLCSKQEDLVSFVFASLVKTEAEFNKEYKDYAPVKVKYAIIKKLVDELMGK